MSDLTPSEVLELVPHRAPCRFLDAVLEVGKERIVSRYTWKDQDCEGHFPGNPVVPGVKMVEMAVQTGIVAWGIYFMGAKASAESIGTMVNLFTHVDKGSFKKMVRPGDTLVCTARFGKEGFFKDGKMAVEAEIVFSGGAKDGAQAFTGLVSGVWIPKESEKLK